MRKKGRARQSNYTALGRRRKPQAFVAVLSDDKLRGHAKRGSTKET